ncbi:hypothetical protein KKG05_04830 [bacterium]|nr:hypothetical protein [bacterium]MBU1936702.1 hypothetical protein [bacterium]
MQIQRAATVGIILIAFSLFIGCGGKKESDSVKNQKDGAVVVPDNIAEKFPRDVPLLPDAKILISHPLAEKGLMLSYETEKGGEQTYRYYKSGLTDNGWKIESDVEAVGVRMIKARKGQRTTSVSLGIHQGKTKVTLHITDKG